MRMERTCLPIIVCGSRFCLQSLWVPVNTNVRCNGGIYKEGPTRSENRGLIWGILVGSCCNCRDGEGHTDARDTVRGFSTCPMEEERWSFLQCAEALPNSAMHGPLTSANRRTCANFVFSPKVRSSIWETPHRATPFSFKLWNFFGSGPRERQVTPFPYSRLPPKIFAIGREKKARLYPASVYVFGAKRCNPERSSRRSRLKREGGERHPRPGSALLLYLQSARHRPMTGWRHQMMLIPFRLAERLVRYKWMWSLLSALLSQIGLVRPGDARLLYVFSESGREKLQGQCGL